MKAPDVIYANDYGIWYKKKPPVKETEKFIRKDALVELIKDEAKFLGDGEMIFGQLLDKLNAL